MPVHTFRMRPQLCEACGYLADAASLEVDEAPKPGDVSMCLGCGAAAELRHDGSLALLSTEALAAMRLTDPGLHAKVERYQRAHRQSGVGRAIPKRGGHT